MANEITVVISLGINNTASTPPGNVQYQNRDTGWRANMLGNNGPTPGTVLVPTKGVNINFAELTGMGGVCRMKNLDPSNFVTWGMFDSITNKFYPLGEMLPGESYVIRLSRDLGQQYGTGSGTGSGSHLPGGNEFLHMRADIAACRVLVEAFDP